MSVTRRNLWWTSILLVGLVSAWLAWPEPATGTGGSAAAGSGTGALRDLSAGQDGGQPAEREDLPGEAAPDRKSALVKGRCVDAVTRRPVPGCRVRVRGHLDQRIPASKGGPSPVEADWRDPKGVVTGPDGRFEIGFVPPTRFRFSVRIQREGRVGYEADGLYLKPGGVEDLDDLALVFGCRVSGSVVDDSGAPQAEVRVSLHRVWDRGEGLQPRNNLSAATDGRGRFEVEEPLVAGRWSLGVADRELLSSQFLVISDQEQGGGSRQVELRVRDESKIPRITGVVVDESGQPLSGVQVENGRPTRLRATPSDAQGVFVARRQQSDTEPTTDLHFACAGYEKQRVKAVAWGTEDLRVVLRRGLGLELLVTQGETQRPVERFGVLLHPARAAQVSGDFALVRSEHHDLAHRGRHPEGRVTLTGLRRGPWVITVVPDDAGLAMSRQHRVEILDRGQPELAIQVFPQAERQVFVHSPDGKPVAGTRIELAETINGRPVTLGQKLLDRLKPEWSGAGKFAWRIALAVTGDDGRAVLRGSRGVDYALRVLGPGHFPVLVQPLRLDPSAGPLEVEVPVGATLRGRLHPHEVLRGYRPSEEFPASRRRPGEETDRQHLPGLVLENLDAKAAVRRIPVWELAGYRRAPIAADGSFEIRDLPPGSWRLSLAFTLASGSSRMQKLQEVPDLRAGEERQVDIDVSSLRRLQLRAEVLVNSEPARRMPCQLVRFETGPDGKPRAVSADGETSDDQGRFELPVTAGEYWLLLSYPGEGSMCAPAPITVAASDDPKHTFSLDAGRARLRLVDGAGKPLSGVTMHGAEVGSKPDLVRNNFICKPTDEAGHAASGLRPAVTYQVWVWPERLSTEKARQESGRKNWLGLQAAKVVIGTVTIEADDLEPAWRDLVVPASAGY